MSLIKMTSHKPGLCAIHTINESKPGLCALYTLHTRPELVLYTLK